MGFFKDGAARAEWEKMCVEPVGACEWVESTDLGTTEPSCLQVCRGSCIRSGVVIDSR